MTETATTTLHVGLPVIVRTLCDNEEGTIAGMSKPRPGEQISVDVEFADGTRSYHPAIRVRAK